MRLSWQNRPMIREGTRSPNDLCAWWAVARPASSLPRSIAQLVSVTLRKNFRKIDPAKSQICYWTAALVFFRPLRKSCRRRPPAANQARR